MRPRFGTIEANSRPALAPMSRPTTAWQTAGGSTFAEHPDLPAHRARILWSAAADPGVLFAKAIASPHGDTIDFGRLDSVRATVTSSGDVEHVAIDERLRRLRLDIVEGTVLAGPVRLRFLIDGPAGAEPGALALRRLLAVTRHGRFLPSLHPPDARMRRWLLALRVHDALADGATQREIATALYGPERVARSWSGRSDALQSRVRRAVASARNLADGAWRDLLHRA